MKTNTISDSAIVLSRINYGETDRILNVLCSKHGKLSVIAKGVRAGKSKLAGGIELFAENELVLLKAKGDLHIVTSSLMKNYFGNIAKNIESTTYAYECLKTINKLVPEEAGEEYYNPLLYLLRALDIGSIPLDQIKIWFGLKLLQNLGSSPNFKTDKTGKQIKESQNFQYDFDKQCFFVVEEGEYSAGHIKILRYLAASAKPLHIKTSETGIIDSAEHLINLLLEQSIA